MKISVIGAGYVGLCTAVGFALKGNSAVCVDIDENKVNAINENRPLLEEDGLETALRKAGRTVTATTDMRKAVTDTEITFISVGTPSREDGSIDVSYVENAASQLGAVLRDKKGFHVVAMKSTVVPGTTEGSVARLLEKNSGKKAGKDFGLCTNPEFLREGSAIRDFLEPDRIIVGVQDEKTKKAMADLYRNFNSVVLFTDLKTAEMIKYASNSFLAAKISVINEIGNICKKLGIDTYEVAKGMGYDKRIGSTFLNAGVGFGGSCFSKDVQAILEKSTSEGYSATLLKEVLDLNKRQRTLVVDMLKSRLGTLKDKKIAILGLAFKAGTDDTRDSPALDIIEQIQRDRGKVVAYDPKAQKNFANISKDVRYTARPEDALDGADACLILTDWPEFKNLSDKDFSKMRGKIIIEGRRVLDRKKVKSFEGVCW